MSADRDQLLEVARQANALFVIPGGVDRLLEPIAAFTEGPGSAEIACAFAENIRSVVLTAGLPYMFALESSHQRRFQLLQCAAELEAVLRTTEQGNGSTIDTDAALSEAQSQMSALAQSEDGRTSLNHETCCVLLRMAESDELREAAVQLVTQAAVLTWGAFEVLCRDLFKDFLNRRPAAYARLVADPEVKKRFEMGKVPLQRVADLGFDLSDKLGELLAEQNDLADLGTIRAVLLALFPSDEPLRSALGQRGLWMLFHQRNLIVHRRGIVDRKYLEATADTRALGSRVALAPKELMTHVQAVTGTAGTILTAARGG